MTTVETAAPFGRRLRTLRLESGLSQQQLARTSTLSVRAIRDLENGRVRRPRADSVRLLAGALGLSAPQLNRLTHRAGAAEPVAHGPFLGREPELATLTTMLAAERRRLVTITGVEGVGKTRLALEAARGPWAAEHATLLWTPHGDNRFRSRRAETIGESVTLLVLDDTRPDEEPASVAADLLAARPRLRILVTTRNPVGMPVDTLFPLAPLPLPALDNDTEELDSVASVALLLAHIERIRPGFRPDPESLPDFARICRALDGLPGALESAAHWSLIYSPRQLADQLAADPLGVARRPRGGQRQQDPHASVRHTVAALHSRRRDVLTAMSHNTSRENDGWWSVLELAERLGRTPVDCADDIYHLLILGLLRRVDRHDVAKFQVLNIVGRTNHATVHPAHPNR